MRSPKAGVYSVVSLDEFEDLVIKDLKAMLSTRVWEDKDETLLRYVDIISIIAKAMIKEQ